MTAAANKRNTVDPSDKGTKQTRDIIRRETTVQRLMKEERKRGNRNVHDLERAASEIEGVYTAITRRLWVKTSTLERVDASEPLAPLQWLVIAHKDRYLPWTEALKTTGFNAQQIITDVVVDDWSLGEVAQARGRDAQFIKRTVLSGLKLYANLAGWGRK